MTLARSPNGHGRTPGWKKHSAAIIVSAVSIGIVLLWVALPSPWGLGVFEPRSPASGLASVATHCPSSPCTASIPVTANSFLFMGFGYSVAQLDVPGTMNIHGYTFTIANEFTKQNFGSPSLQAGFYYWAITSTATVTVYLNYSTRLWPT